MRISEIFYSIQGEGALTGVPSVFVRSSGCNLRCSWCDTPYASWRPEGENLTLDQILEVVESHPATHCVLTGGEPMIAPEMPRLAEELRARGKHITIETAGTVAPEGIPCDLASLSPKLSNSTPSETDLGTAWVQRHEATRRRPDVLRAWVENYDYQFKFVVSSPEDLTEIEAMLTSVEHPIPAWKVQLMPEGTNVETLRAKRDWLLAICKEKGYRFCDRLHISLFGNTRGT